MKTYEPEKLPLSSLPWADFISLVGKANAALARYDGILQGIVNPDVLLSPLTTQEAVLSSKIEGTQATLEEVLEFEASKEMLPVEGAKHADIQEIINYRHAMRRAVVELKKRPISLNLILDIHSALMDSVRGYNKGRGRLRTVQNWIGAPGSPIENATFIPPAPDKLMEHLDNFERYIHFDERDPLVQLAVVHAQFELIHPFADGNGRLGRILVPLFLFEKGLLGRPMFYISAYLEANRSIYYEKLLRISKEGDWKSWINFFLTAITEQAIKNSEKAKTILALYEKMKTSIVKMTHSQFSIQAIDTLFNRPIFKTTDFIQSSDIPRASAIRILNSLKQHNILLPLREGKGRQASILIFKEIIDIVEQ